METLDIEGVQYTKASSVARELGYTADYVGQLCRSGKVDARRVGRAWYVNTNSIKSHKSERYRSTKAATQKQLKVDVKEKIKSDDSYPVPLRRHTINTVTAQHASDSHFYSKVKPNDSVYIEDQTELIPVLTKRSNKALPSRLNVVHADAIPIQIKSKSDSSTFKATELPRIQFTGKVSIFEEDNEIEVEEIKGEKSDSVLNIFMAADTESKPKPKPKPKLEKKSKKVLRRAGAITMKRKEDGKSERGVHNIAITGATEPQYSSRRLTYVITSTVLASAIVLLSLSLETRVYVGDDRFASSYGLNVAAVIEAAKALI